MANWSGGRSSVGERDTCSDEQDDDLECDGSDLDLVTRFESIRCNSLEISDTGNCSDKTSLQSISLHNIQSLSGCKVTCVYNQTGCNSVNERDVVHVDLDAGLTSDTIEVSSETITVTDNKQNDPVSKDADTTNHSNDANQMCNYPMESGARRRELRYQAWKIILKPDTDGDNYLFIAILLLKIELCCQLLALIPSQTLIRVRQNNMFQTALHLAALTDNATLVRRFLVAGVQVDRQDKYGNTALHIACRRRNKTMAEALLQPVRYVETKQNTYEVTYQRIPQNLEIRNFDGQTCFMIAFANNDTAIMNLLISKHAETNVRDIKSGMTCLHIATESENVNTVKYLLEKCKVDINARTYSGFTALDIANIRGFSYIAYLLLCAGAKPELKSTDSVDFLADSDSDQDSD